MFSRQTTCQVLLLVLLAASSARGASGDDWLGQDKPKHFGVTLVLAGGGYGAGALVFESPRARLLSGAALGLGVGIGKELYDATHAGDASWKDLAWDAVGTATGLALAWLIDTLFFEDGGKLRAHPSTGRASALMGAGSPAGGVGMDWNAPCCRAVTLRLP
jgi:uncharacterized protein YfiM (DUF2279 family)